MRPVEKDCHRIYKEQATGHINKELIQIHSMADFVKIEAH